MLQKGNNKLGLTPNFSLPAHLACPGETEVCASVCYASNGFFRMANVKDSHRRNFEASKKPGFVKQLVAEIKQQRVEVLRIHVAGDFYNATYIRKWARVAELCPDTTFYAFTRSWRLSRMMPALRVLAGRKNVQLWWSTDKETHEINGCPPPVKGVRVAHMQLEHGERIPAYTNLIFRVERDTVEKFIEGRLVCPGENGIKLQKKMQCSSCRLCAMAQSIPCEDRDTLPETSEVAGAVAT